MRMVLALCCVLLVTAVNGGGLALAKSLDDRAIAPEAGLIVTDAGLVLDNSYAVDRQAEATPVRIASAMPVAPTGPCTSADCAWLIPSAGMPPISQTAQPVTDSASILLAMAEALQLPPPRV
ncbi:MAG: hypothetical protein JJ908_09405 [Rhizobiales bacterium]|nr:hypothetical protein [Hyphomicrobiales bacterium]MBO6699036.1 hypothetical protein [Hyphomicrobiales bacterium]MBO6736574.1 hypothetical protein [Hyphomicrobiales bacterium]MBO6912352.1 hypothetical protein [Hyphomicrobiales bacterium]MBO6956286.1 hypothetical protein [Hyphomicrobiales bacterium]